MPLRRTGSWGEGLAADYLERVGWTIVQRNYRRARKEIDLVARRGDEVAFVEVKTRSGRQFGSPLDAITSRKRASIFLVAAQWVEEFGSEGLTYRFDAISIGAGEGRGFEVQHVEYAWGV